MIEANKIHPSIELCPLNKGGKPFPTLFWLKRDTELHKNISRLEALGLIKDFEDIISSNPKVRQNHIEDQKKYADIRWQQAAQTIDMTLWSDGFKHRLRDTGFGGIADFNRVRCFHMFYAGHLYQKNLVGEFVDFCFDHKDILAANEWIDHFLIKQGLK